MNVIAQVRGWARGHTRAGRYSPVGQTFHWGLAALVLLQLWWGWRMGRMPVGPDKLDAYHVHAQLGLLTLGLMLLRMTWRALIPGPINDADRQGWRTVAAHIGHYLFYVLLVALPISGWVMWSAMAPEQSLSIFGLPWPHLPLGELASETRWTLMRSMQTLHFWLVVVLVGLIVVHAGAALQHHFIDRDDAFAAMAPLVEPLQPKRPEGTPHTPLKPDAPPS